MGDELPLSQPPRAWAAEHPDPDWHPKVRAFFTYWQSVRPAPRLLPARHHLDPAAMKAVLPGIWLLDLQREPFRLRYRLVGTEVVEYIGAEVTGMWMDEAHPDIRDKPAYLERYRAVVQTGMPSWRRGIPSLGIRQDFHMIENIVLPLASDGSVVDMLAGFSVMYRR